MAKLNPGERARRIKVIENFIGVKYKNPTKLVGRRFRSLNRIYLKVSKFEANGYEFAPSESRGKTLRAEKALVRKIFPQRIPKRVRGVWIPRRTAGPNPQIRFDFENRTFSVGGVGVPETDFTPIERDDFVDALVKEDSGLPSKIDRMLDAFPDDANITPVSRNGGSFKAGYTGNKKFMKEQIKEWIVAYGYSTSPSEDKGPHDMADWLTGFAIIHSGDEGEDQ